jgi:hypothetical protein
MDCVGRAEDCDGQRQLARGGHQVPQGGGRGLLHHAQQGTQSNHQTVELSKNTPPNLSDVYFRSGVVNGPKFKYAEEADTRVGREGF